MTTNEIFAREYRLGRRYLDVSVVACDHFVPHPFPGVDITLHRSSCWVRLQGKKKMLTADLSLGRQARFSERYSRTLWMPRTRIWSTLRSRTLSAVTRIVLHMLTRLENVTIISWHNSNCSNHVTYLSWVESPSRLSGLGFVSGIYGVSGGTTVRIDAKESVLGSCLLGILARYSEAGEQLAKWVASS